MKRRLLTARPALANKTIKAKQRVLQTSATEALRQILVTEKIINDHYSVFDMMGLADRVLSVLSGTPEEWATEVIDRVVANEIIEDDPYYARASMTGRMMISRPEQVFQELPAVRSGYFGSPLPAFVEDRQQTDRVQFLDGVYAEVQRLSPSPAQRFMASDNNFMGGIDLLRRSGFRHDLQNSFNNLWYFDNPFDDEADISERYIMGRIIRSGYSHIGSPDYTFECERVSEEWALRQGYGHRIMRHFELTYEAVPNLSFSFRGPIRSRSWLGNYDVFITSVNEYNRTILGYATERGRMLLN